MSGIQMVGQVTRLPFEYRTPILSGIQMNPVHVSGIQMVTVIKNVKIVSVFYRLLQMWRRGQVRGTDPSSCPRHRSRC